jgi:CRP-like cAMP-binding protein
MNEKQLQNEIFQMEKDEEELLIEEISKKITNHNPITSQKDKEKEIKLPFKRNSILFDTSNPKSKKIRNIEAIYLTLLKFKGLKRYMSYQGLCPQDIRNISCYIKHGYYEKGSYIVRQYDKSNALYGIIKGSVEVRELETIDKTKNIISSITDDNGEDDDKMDKIFKKIPRDYFMSDIESDDDNKNEFNIIKNNFTDGNEIFNSKKNDFYSRRKIKKKLKTVKNISPIKQEKKNSNNLIKKRYSLIKKIAIEEHQTPFEELKGSTLENFKLDFEEKRVTLKKGMCVGEWGIVYNIPRTTSIYCPEDTHIFYLEKKYFNKILLNKFLEGDIYL